MMITTPFIDPMGNIDMNHLVTWKAPEEPKYHFDKYLVLINGKPILKLTSLRKAEKEAEIWKLRFKKVEIAQYDSQADYFEVIS